MDTVLQRWEVVVCGVPGCCAKCWQTGLLDKGLRRPLSVAGSLLLSVTGNQENQGQVGKDVKVAGR